MPHVSRSVVAVLCSGLLAAALPAPGVAEPTSPLASVPTTADLTSVTYRGVTVRVPRSWPVIDLAANPRTCVRLDRNAVYLGTPGSDQDCPAHVIGRAATVHLAPTTAEDRRRAASVRPDVAGEHLRLVPQHGVTVRTTWAPGSDAMAPTGDWTTETERTGAVGTDATKPVTAPQAQPPAAAALATSGKLLTGMAFDTCAAPSTTTMQSWRASPYAAVGIYIGGSMRACGDGNLSANWISTVTSQGWGLIPIYVGLQAPCVIQTGLSHISRVPTTAASQGTSAAADATVQAQRFGLPLGSVLHFDMENYATGDATCTTAVLTFLTAWTRELHRLGYASGVYGNTGSLMTDMSLRIAARDTSFTPPDQVWFARWNGTQTTSDSVNTPAFKDIYWSQHQRLKQYRGDSTETWGGVRIHVDGNWVDAVLPGNATQVDYGPNTLGPGSAGFVFTGSMFRWTPQPGDGLRSRSYSTLTTGTTTEGEGATWSPTLEPGLYAVEPHIPNGGSTGLAHYTIRDANGTTAAILDQSTGKGYRRIGTHLATVDQPIIVHLGDNDPSPTPKAVAADAMRFRKLAGLPGAPTDVTAAPGSSSALVSWAPAPDNGTPVTAYTVTATPGGASVTVPGTDRSALLTGLVNGTTYTLTVTATNLVGDGPVSGPSLPVVPTVSGGLAAVTPVRILDTRVGVAANPTSTILPAGGSVRIRVAGVAGSPVPAGASSVAANLTVLAGGSPGHLEVVGTSSSLINFAPRQTVANVAVLRLDSDGSVRLRNAASGPVHVIVDVQGYVSTSAQERWHALSPTRLVDTRAGVTANPRATPLGPGESLEVAVAASTTVDSPVAEGAAAAALRLTVVGQTRIGHLTVSDGAATTASALNFVPGAPVGNLTLARLSPTGRVIVTNHSAGTVHLVIDAVGEAVAAGSNWTPVTPMRLFDTRVGTVANARATAIAPYETVRIQVAGGTGTSVPTGATAAGVNVTVTGSTAAGWVATAATGIPTVPVVNFSRGQTLAGFTVQSVAADGTVMLRNGSAGTVHVVVDAMGYTAP